MIQKEVYEIMHGSEKAASLDTRGHCHLYDSRRMPYQLYLEEGSDLDILVNNITNFYYWCASRLLTLDRKYAKEILASIGASQARTDRDRAQVALSYHCLTLTDIHWVRKEGEEVSFEEINLYENHLDNALIDLSLRGREITVENSYLISDNLSTGGCFPKAWLREGDMFILLKDGAGHCVEDELLASRICQCFCCRQVKYQETWYDGQKVSSSRLITSLRYSIVSREAFDVYALNRDLNPLEYILELDSYSYYMMNILDYLVGNTDRHWGNWGLWVDNSTNEPVGLHPVMDFNQVFRAYDTLEGAVCQTALPGRMSQREAALEAVEKAGLNQIKEIDRRWFDGREREYNMFCARLEVLIQKHKKKGKIKNDK